MEELDQDRLSSLPKIILHCILSKLPEKDAAKTSVLSKAWLDTWYTFPILSFSTSKFMEMSPVQQMEDSEKMRKMLEFCDYVKRSILRFHDQSLVIKEFKLQVDYFGLDYISKEDVPIWIKLACECGVESLILYNCKMIERIDISSVRLKVLMLMGINDVSIDAPSLETLCYSPNYFAAPFKIDFDRCKNLKELCMLYVTTSTFLTEQFPKFPFLEILKLSYCKMSERINISSVRLKVLKLSHCYNSKEVNIDAPNLLSFGYIGHGASEPTISFLRNSSQLEVNIGIHVDYVDLCNLRKFMQNIKPNNVLTSL